MWIDPKTNWTSKDVPLPDDFNRIEGDVKELKAGVDGLAGAAKITVIVSDSKTLEAGAGIIVPLLPSSAHRFYLISVYSPTAIVVETDGIHSGWVTWYLRQDISGATDDLTIINQRDLAATIYIKAAYIS